MKMLTELIDQNRWNDVEHRTRALVDAHPTTGMVWKILSVALARQGKDALPALLKAAEFLPQDAEAQSNLGAVFRDLGQWADAAKYLRRSLSIDATAASIHDALGTALGGLGQLESALASFQRAIELRPDFAMALVHAANLVSAAGRAREAITLYRRALRISPDSLEARNNLANAYYALGLDEEALGSYQSALDIRSDDAAICSNKANTLRRLGRFDEAIETARRAVALQPNLVAAHNTLGLALAAQGRFDEASGHYRRALALDPGCVDAMNNLGNALRDLGDRRECLALYARAIELDPKRVESYCNMGNALFELRRIDDAADSYRQALMLSPDHGPAHLSLAMALRMQGRPAEAEVSARTALAIDPDNVETLSLLGELLADRGRFSEAQQLFERVVTINPDFPFVYLSIAMHRRMSTEDAPWLQKTESLAAKNQTLRHAISLRYALGKYFDDTRQYALAFDNYRRANELTKLNGIEYDREALARRVDRIIDTFDSSSRRWGRSHGHASDRPVFVVGMPRSGTSLTEQILASHPAVFGAGELDFWDTAFSRFVSTGGAKDFSGIATDYLERMTTASADALRVVDKMPPNFINLGLIHAVFPRAKIIHMRRHPIDTCLSIYFQYFLNTHPYSNDLDSLAHYYGEYLKIMRHWRTYLPAGALLEVPYESLIVDQEAWTRRIIDFVELPWDSRCLEFHLTDRVVITASKWQVRQKIHNASAGRWKHYEQYVGPLFHLIQQAGHT